MPYIIFEKVIFATLFEETLYRGILINPFCKYYKRKYPTNLVSLLTSSFIFAWIHPILPEYKILGGLVLGSIYLVRRNMWMNIMTHASANIIFIYFDVI